MSFTYALGFGLSNLRKVGEVGPPVPRPPPFLTGDWGLTLTEPTSVSLDISLWNGHSSPAPDKIEYRINGGPTQELSTYAGVLPVSEQIIDEIGAFSVSIRAVVQGVRSNWSTSKTILVGVSFYVLASDLMKITGKDGVYVTHSTGV